MENGVSLLRAMPCDLPLLLPGTCVIAQPKRMQEVTFMDSIRWLSVHAGSECQGV